ncbi:OLC1v1030620C1 [Oldenlandia corymbosa var. corymbosa]|uniref:OLC1v1030620C1 n=1 Tax=Oldenlandia corymbosa var. corymbosa TaxID=529605 RepID=A0AAV1CHC5_OLDCO|nr:OLC1v1030620C1 [Oldenlandia corymbosa var. corymbosa]
MVGDQPPVAPHKPPKSFASFFHRASESVANKDSLIKPVKFINGTPILEYKDDEFEKLVAPHRLSLVGKFSYGRSKMEEVYNEFKKIGFNGGYNLGLMNSRHVLICFEEEQDYKRCWIRTFWNIAGYSMRILKWTPGFRFEEDPPVAPIWVSLCDLLIEYMHPEVIFSMATAIGQPLKVDTPTLNMTRPSVARFCVEVDLMKELPKSVKIGKRGRKHEQIFTYEHVPAYCSKCSIIGHKERDCRIGKPAPQKIVVDKITAPNEKKNGIKMAKQKVKLGSKKPHEKSEVEVEIINANPPVLIPGESTSGLSASEKTVIPMDILDSTPPKGVTEEEENQVSKRVATQLTEALQVEVSPKGNRFSVLADIDEVRNGSDSSEENVEHILVEKPSLENNSAPERRETLALASIPQAKQLINEHSDDCNVGSRSLIEDSEEEHVNSDDE